MKTSSKTLTWMCGYSDGVANRPLEAKYGPYGPVYQSGWRKGQEDRQHNINRTLDQEKKSMIHENVTTAIERAKIIAKDTNQNVTIWHFRRSRQSLIVESFFILYPKYIFPLDYFEPSDLFQPIMTYHPNGRAYLSKK